MKKIGVLGTGTMGAGIIQVLAQNGYDVVMRARRESSVEKGLATVKKNLDKMVAKEKITARRDFRKNYGIDRHQYNCGCRFGYRSSHRRYGIQKSFVCRTG